MAARAGRKGDGSRVAARSRSRQGPGRPRGATGPGTRSRILDQATDLYSRRGAAAVGVREVAAAAGVNVATVHHHFGGKAQLHDAVFARMYEAESAAVGEAVRRARERIAADPDELLPGLHDVLDAYIGFLEDHHEVTYLWLRRWLEPELHGRLDEDYALPLYRQVEELLAEADRAGRINEPAAHAAVRSIVWAAHGYVTATAAGDRRAAAGGRREFREFAHRMVDRLWGDP